MMVVLLFQYRICITDSTYFKIKYMIDDTSRNQIEEAFLKLP